MAWQRTSTVVMALALAAGCAEDLRPLRHGENAFSTGVLFWPPPPATSRWVGCPSQAGTLGEAAAAVRTALEGAGYTALEWMPIGAHHEHGFAVTTRLERIDDSGAPDAERWMDQCPRATTLRWLGESSEAYLPKRGRYRALLVAFTDLHDPAPGRPPRWDETTAMAGAPLPSEVPPSRRVAPGSRLGVYVYEYESPKGSLAGEGFFVPGDVNLPAEMHLPQPGLAALAREACAGKSPRATVGVAPVKSP